MVSCKNFLVKVLVLIVLSSSFVATSFASEMSTTITFVPIAGGTNVQIKILSKLNIQVPRGRKNIQLLRGSFYDSVVTDDQLRQLYQSSLAVVVPLKDVNQPSGYSVTLQAMACGKPVILTKTCGLWDTHLFKSGENCILVDAYNPRQIAEAILRLNDDKDLRSYIGNKARETACAHFGIERMNAGIVELIKTSWSRR